MGAGVVGAIVAGVLVAAGLAAAGRWVRQRTMRAKPPQSSHAVRTEALPEPKAPPTPQSKETIRLHTDRI